MELEYNIMTADDLDRIMEIEEQVFSNPWEQTMFRSSIDHYLCWKLVDKINNKTIGYLIGELIIDEFSIYNLAVCKEYQQQGTGGWFTNEIIREMREQGAQVFFLEVRRSNLAARKLYNRLGFQEVYVRKNYYTSPVEDALIMMKDERNKKRIIYENL